MRALAADAHQQCGGPGVGADRMCPTERFERLRQELGDAFMAVEIDSSPGNPDGNPKSAHSVLTEHLIDREGTATRAAFDQVLEFFRRRLVTQ